jgi:lysine 2,3-aminomutase
MQKLLEARVRPYYLHLLDRVPGTAHFQVPLEQALTLVASLRGRMSGMAIPHLMLDLPGGGGKVALTPETVIRKEPGLWLIRNWQGKTFPYPLDGRQGSL